MTSTTRKILQRIDPSSLPDVAAALLTVARDGANPLQIAKDLLAIAAVAQRDQLGRLNDGWVPRD